MTKKQKEIRAKLVDEHFAEWVKARREQETRLSNAQTMFCCCGQLATGLHEKRCGKFRDKVDAATVQALRHLVDGSEQ